MELGGDGTKSFEGELGDLWLQSSNSTSDHLKRCASFFIWFALSFTLNVFVWDERAEHESRRCEIVCGDKV